MARCERHNETFRGECVGCAMGFPPVSDDPIRDRYEAVARRLRDEARFCCGHAPSEAMLAGANAIDELLWSM